MHDVTKLPQWAQAVIQDLESGLIEANRHLAELEGPTLTKSNTFILMENGLVHPLPRNSRIRFEPATDSWVEATILDGALSINADYPLRVMLKAANSIEIRVERPFP